MRLKFELDCPPDLAWDLLKSPGALTAISRPFLSFAPVGNAALPERWTEGPHPVEVHAFFNVVRVGEQVIDVSFREASSKHGTVRIFADDGGPTSGALTAITRWKHQMAVSPAPGNRTLYRDQLTFSAGALTPVVAIGLWLFWQWRGAGIRKLASRLPRV